MKPDNAFGQAVRQRRRSLDLTQEELARRVGCAPVTLRKIEYGDLRPSQQIAERLAMALAISLDERAEFVRQARAVQPGGRTIESSTTPQVTPEEIGLEDLSGRAIRGYMLGEKIGAGSFGAVYRGVQPLVEREVAIKIILPKHANHPDFIRRFEAEAQLVARLEHPHIVPLYDYWREPGVAYLVMRLLRGGSMQELIERGPLSLDQIARLLDQIGSALQAAHRSGVVHRDLKPSNVLLDEDGNAYLADFGIAKNLGNPDEHTQTGMIIGSPAYISPEQINAEAVRPQTDIYSLGVMLYEMLTGAKPFAGPTPILLIQQHLYAPMPPLAANQQGLPAALDDIIARATAKDQAQRYAEVDTLLADFKQVVLFGRLAAPSIELAAPGSAEPPFGEIVSPYKGLRPFEEADAPDFFGREALTQQLLVRLGEGGDLARFLAIIGPSGSGKSSVVGAGLIPALRRGGLPGSENWFVVELLPSTHPLEELEAALLRIAVNPPESMRAQIREDKRGLLRAIQRSLPADPNTELVLVIDQFEEVFTLVDDESERAHLLDSLVEAVLTERSRVRVIITLRADFIDRPLRYMDFGELMQRRSELVLPLTPDELERAIVGPADRVGLRLEPGLAEAISADVIEQPGALPLLQYALTELFEKRSDHTLTKAAYQSIGGVRGALGRRAEEVYGSLDEASQSAARQVFLRLVTLGEGTEDVRRRVLRSELEGLTTDHEPQTADASSMVRRLSAGVDAFGKARLLSFDRDLQTRGPTIEVAHEALLREWPRFREWLDDSRSDVRMQRTLANAAAEWISANRDPSYLLQGARLAQFEGWVAAAQIALTHDERAFFDASLAERQARQATEADRQRRELEAAQKLAETEKRRAEEQSQAALKLRRRAVYLRGALLIAAVLAFVAVIFGQQSNNNAQQAQSNLHSAQTAEARAIGETQIRATAEAVAVNEREQAQQQARIAQSRELAAAAMNNLTVDSELSILLAREAIRVDNIPEAQNALHQAILASRLRATVAAHAKSVYGVAISSDGRRFASAGLDGTVKVWTLGDSGFSVSQSPVLTLPNSIDFDVPNFTSGYTLAFAPDGSRLAAIGEGRTVKIWDALSGRQIQTLAGHSEDVYCLALSPDGKLLATGSADKTVKVWDAVSGRELLTLTGHTAEVYVAVFSPDGKYLATGGEDKTVTLWDLESKPITGRQIFSLISNEVIQSITFSPDGKRLVVSPGFNVQVWNRVGETWAITPTLSLNLSGHTNAIIGSNFNPDGTQLVTGGNDGKVKIWDAATGQELFTLAGGSGVSSIALSPDGTHLLTANTDGTVKLWNISATGNQEWFDVETAYRGRFSSDGKRLITSSGIGESVMTLQLWEVSPIGIRALQSHQIDHGARMSAAVFSPDLDRIITVGADMTAKIWDVSSGKQLQSVPLSGHTDFVFGLALSTDNTRIATGSDDGTAKIWDLVTGQAVLTLTGHTAQVRGVAFSPDGQRLATGSFDGTARIWDAETGQVLHELSSHEGEIINVAFSPDGSRLLTSGAIATLWDAQTGNEILTVTGFAAGVFNVVFSSDGTRIATGSVDNTVKVWGASNGQELLTFPGMGVEFSPDVKHLITYGVDGMARGFFLDVDDLMTLARSRVTRTLTAGECQKYLHVEQCPQ